MLNRQSSKGKYALAALAGAAAGGVIVALSTRAVPKMMSEMEGKCKQMMADMKECNGGTGEKCQRMMAGMGQDPEPQACPSQGASCHGSH